MTKRDLPLRVYPALTSLAVARGEERLYLLWTVAKELHSQYLLGAAQRGIRHERLVRTLAVWTGYARSSIRKLLVAGEGTYWDTESAGGSVTPSSRRVFLPSPDRLAEKLGQTGRDGEPSRCAGSSLVRADLASLVEPKTGKVSARRWRQVLCGASLPQKAARMPRGLVAAKTGVSPTTQRRWENEGAARYHDGHGVAPVASPAVFSNSTALIPTHPELGQPGVRAVLQEESCTGRTYQEEGYFPFRSTNAQDGSKGQPDGDQGRLMLCRQLPKSFQSGFRKTRRRVNKYRQTNPSHDTCYWHGKGRADVGNHLPVLVSYADKRPGGKKAPVLWEAPTYHHRMREATATSPHASLDTVLRLRSRA